MTYSGSKFGELKKAEALVFILLGNPEHSTSSIVEDYFIGVEPHLVYAQAGHVNRIGQPCFALQKRLFRPLALGNLLQKLFILSLKHFSSISQGKMCLDPCQNFVHLKGFSHIVNTACAKSPDLVDWFIKCADENNRDVVRPMIGLKCLAHFEPVHVGHHDVQKYQVRRV